MRLTILNSYPRLLPSATFDWYFFIVSYNYFLKNYTSRVKPPSDIDKIDDSLNYKY